MGFHRLWLEALRPSYPVCLPFVLALLWESWCELADLAEKCADEDHDAVGDEGGSLAMVDGIMPSPVSLQSQPYLAIIQQERVRVCPSL
jgi:hypothetical protein